MLNYQRVISIEDGCINPFFGFVWKSATPFHPMLKIGIFSIKLAINDGVTPPFPDMPKISPEVGYIIKEPWATPNRATPKSGYPFKRILNKSKNRSKKQKQTFQKINPTIQKNET